MAEIQSLSVIQILIGSHQLQVVELQMAELQSLLSVIQIRIDSQQVVELQMAELQGLSVIQILIGSCQQQVVQT